jgi:hypothetical protein
VKSNALLVAFGVGWVAASPGNLKHSHHKLGVIIFALVFFQFFLGIGIAVFHRLQSKQPRECRSFTEYALPHHSGMIHGLKIFVAFFTCGLAASSSCSLGANSGTEFSFSAPL